MKEEEKKDEKPVEGAEGVQGKGMDFGMTENGGNKPAEGGEEGDGNKGKDPLPGQGTNGPIRG